MVGHGFGPKVWANYFFQMNLSKRPSIGFQTGGAQRPSISDLTSHIKNRLGGNADLGAPEVATPIVDDDADLDDTVDLGGKTGADAPQVGQRGARQQQELDGNNNSQLVLPDAAAAKSTKRKNQQQQATAAKTTKTRKTTKKGKQKKNNQWKTQNHIVLEGIGRHAVPIVGQTILYKKSKIYVNAGKRSFRVILRALPVCDYASEKRVPFGINGPDRASWNKVLKLCDVFNSSRESTIAK